MFSNAQHCLLTFKHDVVLSSVHHITSHVRYDGQMVIVTVEGTFYYYNHVAHALSICDPKRALHRYDAFFYSVSIQQERFVVMRFFLQCPGI